MTQISVPGYDSEAINAVIFGFLVQWFTGEFLYKFKTNSTDPNDRKWPMVVNHFHEWQVGTGLVISRMKGLSLATVFTTHATLLGRHLCAASADFYNNLHSIDCDKESGDRRIYAQYCIERASTASAHIFTTVSDITGEEATHLLRRSPDYITPNGLNVVKFAAPHEFQSLHAKSKDKIENFVRGHFHNNLDFDLEQTLYFFTAGRYEFGNKGVDMFIESLARLNYQLQSSQSDKTVIVFLIFPAKTNSYNVETMKGQATVKSIQDTVNGIQEKIGKRLFQSCMQGKYPDAQESDFKWLDAEDSIKLKKLIYTQNLETGMPPICTHNMVDGHNDPILANLRRCGLLNRSEDRVKVIFHPEFLKETSPLLPMTYTEFVRGCHMGVFPSYYEPWGYTPAECTAMGIPNVTTNLSGFGGYMEQRCKLKSNTVDYGIYVVDRKFKGTFGIFVLVECLVTKIS